MTGRRTPWPGVPADELAPDAVRPEPAPAAEAALRERLTEAVAASDAPDVVFAVSRRGRRTLHSGGTVAPPDVPREDLRYETGSASKTFTALLLTRLIRRGVLTGGEPAAGCLAPGTKTGPHPVTLAHLITHTSGLPALPADFVRRGLPAWRTNPYARYSAERLVDTFLRHTPRHRPGTRWHYSNYGVSVLGHAIAATTGTPWDHLITGQVLRALGLSGTALRAEGPETDAVGRRKDGRTPVPAFDAGGFQAAGAVRSTPNDLLTFLEAHLDPARSPAAGALRAARVPVLRRGPGHRHVHTVGWFRHPTDGGPMYFHSGATLGQQAFLGFRPDTDTALAAVCTRRFRARDPFIATAYALLSDDRL